MGWLISAAILGVLSSGNAQGTVAPVVTPACKGISVTLVADASLVKAPIKPQFSVVVTNDTKRPVRILDLRDGRRADLQDNYLELFVVQDAKAVDVPVAISDPGPLSSADFLELQPGARLEFGYISYKLMLEKLLPGSYEAFILFWRDPMQSHMTRCRSTSARFTVQN